MSPRPAVTRHDLTAVRLLTAAAELIDGSMGPQGGEHPRLRSLRFPAALDWIRIEDVLRAAAERPEGAISKKALVNRWETREEFLRDAILFAVLYDGDSRIGAMDPSVLLDHEDRTFGDVVAETVEDLYADLVMNPRSFLLCQFAPYFGLHPTIAERVAAAGEAEQNRWSQVFATLAANLPVGLRPEWNPERAGIALQCMLDGFVMRYRINPAMIEDAAWAGASLMADTVLTLLAGMLDLGADGESAHHHLDRRLVQAEGLRPSEEHTRDASAVGA